MAQWSNKWLVVFIIFLFSGETLFSQMSNSDGTAKDYKDPKSHERFRKRRKVIGAWQINQLKKGALVVRLKTNQKTIDALRAQGNDNLANEKEAEQYLINKNIIRAYLNNYDFSKVYFMPSNYSDTLLNGRQQGIFVDSNLTIDQSIAINEPFYMIAEPDYVYNSSIGFVPQDSARYAIESGNPLVEQAIVIKNKYGHQLKGPFPYHSDERTLVNTTSAAKPVRVERKGKTYNLSIEKRFTYEKYASAVSSLNQELRSYFQSNPSPEGNKDFADAKPFLY